MSEMSTWEAPAGATLGSRLGALLSTSGTRQWRVEGEERFCGPEAGPNSLPNVSTPPGGALLHQGSIGWRAMG